ncbi:DUF5753 domain-containing protein [Spirillospora sp. NPDC048911]|uniref:DUF5753 domain-containing protein n=1 Tax=Spirillospora sp. NPDC048911 TaxID=3364527 RepID=UPI003721D8D7
MTERDRDHPFAEVATLLADNRRIADTPTFADIYRVSVRLEGQVVAGVRVERLPRSTANDLLRLVPQTLKWGQVSSFWAVLFWIADQDDRLDARAMHSLRELRRRFNRSASHSGAASNQGLAADLEEADATGIAPAVAPEGLAEMGLVGPGQHRRRQEATERLLANARRRRATAWWSEYGDIVTEWSGPQLTLEWEASEIRYYGPSRFPDLLQTADYARYVIRQDSPGIDDVTLARRVELLMRRQELLRRSDPPNYLVVIGERALRDRDTPPAIMREQLKHLITMANFQHITVQFVADEEAELLLRPIPMAITRFTEPGYSDLVYLEHHALGIYHTGHDKVSYFALRYNALLVKALLPHVTVGMLLDVLDRLPPEDH